ncbi:MAG: GNAT family N-acetyltransferase [Saprospiraceae bacterium]
MQKINSAYLDIHVDTKNNRIFFPVKDHNDAELHYKLHTDTMPTVMEFKSTFVPEQFRNQGIGSQLVEKGMRLAKANQYGVKATCPFVEHYLGQHPEFQPMRAELT